SDPWRGHEQRRAGLGVAEDQQLHGSHHQTCPFRIAAEVDAPKYHQPSSFDQFLKPINRLPYRARTAQIDDSRSGCTHYGLLLNAADTNWAGSADLFLARKACTGRLRAEYERRANRLTIVARRIARRCP